jgi:hypothetical protein
MKLCVYGGKRGQEREREREREREETERQRERQREGKQARKSIPCLVSKRGMAIDSTPAISSTFNRAVRSAARAACESVVSQKGKDLTD